MLNPGAAAPYEPTWAELQRKPIDQAWQDLIASDRRMFYAPELYSLALYVDELSHLVFPDDCHD